MYKTKFNHMNADSLLVSEAIFVAICYSWARTSTEKIFYE